MLIIIIFLLIFVSWWQSCVLCEANEGAWDNEVDDADDMFDNTNDSLTHDHDQLFAGDQD